MSYNNNYGQIPQMQQQQNSGQYQQHGFQQNPNMRPMIQQQPPGGFQNQQQGGYQNQSSGQGYQSQQPPGQVYQGQQPPGQGYSNQNPGNFQNQNPGAFQSQQQMGYRQLNQEQHRQQLQFIQQQQGNPEMPAGSYVRQSGVPIHQQRTGNPQIHVPTVTVSQPHQFQNQNPPGEHNMGQNVNFGGPTSVGQPQSISSNFPNPPSTSHHAPGSVNPPSTGGPLAPGSVGGHNPTSVGQLAPTSVGTHGPTSVPQHGPTSVPQHGPTSVNHPTSVGHGPTSVGAQGPTSIHAAPTSVGPPGSLQTGGPGSVLQEKPPSSSQGTDFGFPQRILDPVAELKVLILKDLRRATTILNDEVADAIAFVQEQQQLSTQEANPHSVVNPHSLAANNPLSVNPQSIHNPQSISAPKSIDDSHHRKHSSFSKEKYQNSWMQFFAVCDKIEAKATLLTEAQRIQTRFDRMCEYKVPAEITTHGYPTLIQPFLEAMRSDRIKMMETVKILNDSLQEFRKVADEGEFLSVAKTGPLSTIFYEKSSSDEEFGDLAVDYRASDYFYPNIPAKKKYIPNERLEDRNPRIIPERSIANIKAVSETRIPEPAFAESQFQVSKTTEIHQMEPAKAEMLGYEEDDQMDEECDPPPPPPIPRPSN
ncbi:hypothetical protein FO519_005630 [Halicephalobus sp. NKZ332]|nr:hypothetical protein FO519_005630 [Halicephalobus sp. NKZ332]